MTEQDCRKCKSYKGCIGADWYSYQDIKFCPFQIVWILENSETFSGGRWPEDSNNSSDSFTGERVRTEGAFVKPAVVFAEVEERLKRTDNQGELLVTQVEDERTLETLSSGAREILMYVKGKKRKKIGFKRWLKEVYYQPKTGEKHQFVET